MNNQFWKISFLFVLIHITIIFSADAQKKTPKPTGKQSGYYSEEHALECVKDYYEFYNADECYKNPRVRRVSGNTFYISVKYCTGGRSVCYKKEYLSKLDGGYIEVENENEFFWSSKVLILVCNSKTKYNISTK